MARHPMPERPVAAPHPVAELASRLGDRIVVLSGFREAAGAPLVARTLVSRRTELHEVAEYRYERADLVHLGRRAGCLWLVPVSDATNVTSIRLTTRGDRGVARGAHPETPWVDLRTLLLRSGAAALKASERAELMRFLLIAATEAPSDRPPRTRSTEDGVPALSSLSGALFTARELLRERLRLSRVSRDAGLAMSVEVLVALDSRTLWAEGWVSTDDGPPVRLTAVSPEGTRIELLDTLFRYERPDVEQFFQGTSTGRQALGFLATIELARDNVLADGWVFELETTGAETCEVGGPTVGEEVRVARDILTAKLSLEEPGVDVLRRHLRPGFASIQARHAVDVKITTVEQNGTPPHDPDVSVVVCLYQRIDFVEHQLAQFVHDPEMREVDLIYVLDSPEMASEFRAKCRRLYRLYQVPFRSVVLSANSGFAGANNLGASLARGRLLVLLNSDVIPARPGWVSTMGSFYDTTPAIGALGALLLYEDDSIQHAGLFFDRPPGETEWQNEHYYKGLHSTLPAANVARPVPAVTAACVMVGLDLFRSLEGLRGMFLQGDYEDSDLCLRLIEAGYENWICPAAVLYHLEGQSYPSERRSLNATFNRWLHTQTWDDLIGSVMASHGHDVLVSRRHSPSGEADMPGGERAAPQRVERSAIRAQGTVRRAPS